MGKPTGFMEYPREPKHERSPLERVKDWSEEHPPYGEETLRRQGARCMDCGVPFCHTGTLIAGMASGCPVNNLIPRGGPTSSYKGQWAPGRYIPGFPKNPNNFPPSFTGGGVLSPGGPWGKGETFPPFREFKKKPRPGSQKTKAFISRGAKKFRGNRGGVFPRKRGGVK